ncbi:MAG: CDP-glucose 4,6-dehydratase [Tateyamaria sp.]|uniref:CDP-glucose 4,6-dehydratase n=1 Tax=Tateyamaria sp. TaxID=1929288 RepID=UPI00329D9EC7
MDVNAEFWAGKKVLVTGHTGFKGGWLSMWLADMGAVVTGIALDPPTDPGFFEVTGLRSHLDGDLRIDIRDKGLLADAVANVAPDILLHLAAQPLVRRSYVDPVETYETNVMGTIHVLEAVRATPSIRAVVNVTTDKCYENREWVWPYREDEAMGGHDPYSSSKGCAELVTSAYRRSFFAEAGVQIATARAGNVIGGGDWAKDRLIPDIFRSIDAGEAVLVRSPSATRPWQHVMEPVAGYLMLAQALWNSPDDRFAEGWNFGPEENDTRSVQWIVEHMCSLDPAAQWQLEGTPQPHEANLLMLSSSKAKAMLGWRTQWNLPAALEKTLSWHIAWREGDDMAAVTMSQIKDYTQAALTHA